MTLKEYIKSLPKDRVQLAATDLNEAAKIEQEHAALPGAIFDSADQIDGKGSGQTGEDTAQPAAPTQSFDLTNDDDVKGFIKGMELSHPELVNRLRRDERAWDDMLALDRRYTARLQRDGQVKFTGDDKSDYDFFRWAYGRGMVQSDTSIGGLATAFGRGLWQMAKGAAKLGATAAKSVANPAAAVELGATTVDAAQAAVAEYQQLGAGLAALTSGDNPQVKMAAMYELAKFADGEQKTHNAWRKAINDSFAEVPVDEDSVEFLSEAFDISNLIGAGAGKVVTTGLKRAGAAGAAELLGKSRKALGSEMLAAGLSKIPVIGTPYKRAILVGQADLLSEEAQIAYKAVAEAQADLAAKRATLAAAPAADPKDVLLKQVAEAEANVARQQAAFDVANTKLTTVRQGVTEALDLEGRGLIDRAASGAVEGAGVAVRGTGRAMTRAYRGLSELLTGEADNAAFDMAAGQVAGNLANKGNIVTRIGQDMVAAGRTMGQNGATIPYFRRLRQAEDATKLTRGAAAFIDWSHLGWAADKVGDTLKAGAAGAPVSGAFGYVASGGDLAAAAESAGAGAAYGIGGGAYGQWEAYTDPRFRYEELLANRRQFRDTLSARDVGGASQLQIFDQLDAGDQLAVSTYAQGKPDVAFRFINDRNQASGYYDRDNNVVVINKASKTPVADIFRHEVAHFVERHGLQAQVREMYLGDAEKGVIGQYTALDPLGNPVFVESTDPDGTTRYGYKLNEAGEKLKADYESKIRVVDPTFKMSDDYLASELFAEQYADRMLGGGFRRDLSRNAVDNIVDALAAKPVLKNFLGGIGLLFDQNDNVVGTGVFKELKANEGVRRLISGFTSEVSKGKKAAIEDSAEQHVFTETELRNPELATKWLQGGGAMRFGPDGKPVYDSKGVPQFLTEKEADAQQRDLANELITEIEKHVASNPEDADLMQRREIVDVNGVKRTLFSGRRIPAAVIDALEKQNRFNPHQLAHLRAASASVEKNGTGAMIAHFYQAASRKLGGKAYKTVGGRWRRDGVVGFQITKDGNVVINSVSWEQLAENATKAAKTKLAREVYATAGMPVDTAIMADVKTYLGNLVDGKPGATDIGEARRDFINNLLGIRMAANADANPLFETTTAPKTILTNLRLDRINRMAPLDYVDVAWGPQQYRQAKANMRPEVLPVPERFTGTGEEGDRQSKKVDAPSFFKRFDIQEYTKGGKYFDLASGEDVTGRVYASGSIDVGTGKPSLRASDTQVDAPTGGRKIRTNLFKQSAGWKWVGKAPAKTSTLVSVEMGKDHLYTLNSQFDTPVEMARYEDKKSEPRLRPTTRGVLRVGEKVGEIEVRGRIHPVYDKITTAADAPGRGVINRGEDSLQFRPEGNEETTRIAADYVKKAFGREYDPHTTYDEAPEDRLKQIADYFQNVAKHRPDAPEVLRSYRAMARETIEQYNAMIAAGIKPEPYSGKGEPYASSEEMMRDVRENKHLYFLRTDNAFGQGTQDAANPLLEKSGKKIGNFELLVNDVFRVVHDYFGHTQQGLQFGPRGEFNAWKSHSRMYSEEAQGAVAAETLAQNAWVNFGAHLRRADGSIPKKGEADYVPPQDRPFGEQKNFLVPQEMMQFRPDDLGFDSQLERTLAAIPEKASRQQIEAALRDGVKEKGQLKERPVKAEEMADVRDVTGLSFAEWMKQNPQATREQMLDFARQNRVRVSMQEMAGDSKYEVLQDNELTDAEFATEREADRYVQNQVEWYRNEHTIDDDGMTDPNGERMFSIENQNGKFVVFDSEGYEVGRWDTLRGAKTFLRDYLDSMMVNEVGRYDIREIEGAGYSDYTLPGGDNYRVHVLTLPKSGQGAGYTSSHFRDTKNYLAHVRIKDRTTPDGKSVLFAEEIQSDLHQSGRERGYKERKATPDTTGWSVYKREKGEYGEIAHLSTPYGYTSLGGGAVTDVSGMTDEQVISKVAGQMWEAENRNKIPSAPFKKTWHEMAFKYLLKQAVDSGADYLGWTTGEQQSERYDLSKQVNSIEWDPAEQNKIVSIGLLNGDGNTIEFAVKPDGTITGISGKSSGTQFEGKSISEVVGKDLGQRILGERDGRVSGNGLKVGGEGMKGFYDRIVPQFADKYLKKYGIKTSSISVPTFELGADRSPNIVERPYGAPDFRWVVQDARGERIAHADSREAAVKALAEAKPELFRTVHAVSITPELKADISQYGQVQYRPEQSETPGSEAAGTDTLEHPGRLRIGNVPTKKSAEEFIAIHKLTDVEADAYREVVNDVRTSDKTALPVEPQYDDSGRPTFETDYNDDGEKVTTLKVRQIRYDFLNAPEVAQIRDRSDKKYQSRIDDLTAKRGELRAQDGQLVASVEQLETERKTEGTTKARKDEIRAQIAKIKEQRASLREKSAKLAEKIEEEKSGWRDGKKHEWVDKATDAVAAQIVQETRKAELEPTVKAGIGWYSKMRAWLQSRFGAGIESFSQLLGATSARTPVDENFKQSLDALRRISRGDYDGLLNAYHEHVTKTNERVAAGEIDADAARRAVNQYIEDAVSTHDERVIPIIDAIDEVKKQAKAGKLTQEAVAQQIAELEAKLADANSTAPIPLRSNGKKFNANTPKVLQALYGNWLEMVQGPKTPNFSGNLSGRTLKATIDVWAARTLRRLLYENKTYNPETGRISNGENRWRILPEAETGVEHSRQIGREIGGDFGFAQEAFQKAADQMGMNADDLQALLWFHEKHVWDLKGWTKAAGKVKSSFESEAGKLNTERFQLGATTSTSPSDNSYHEAYVAQEAFARELRRTRDSIAETPGMVYARVTPSEGLYGGAMEPSFDAEFVADRGVDVSPVLQKLINVGREYRQYDVFMSKVVDKDHPNSRPGLEIGFRTAETKEFVDSLTEALRANGIDGFTVARDRRGRAIGIRTQFVPEMTARWVENWTDYLDSDKVRVLAVDWGNNARNALKSLSPEIRSKLSYESETYFDTRVFGREEYDKASNTWAASTLDAELGRRRPVVEEHKRRQ